MAKFTAPSLKRMFVQQFEFLGKFRGFLCKNVAGEQGLALQHLSLYKSFFFEKEMQTVMKSHCLMPSSLKLGHFDSSVSDSFEHELN